MGVPHADGSVVLFCVTLVSWRRRWHGWLLFDRKFVNWPKPLWQQQRCYQYSLTA